MCASGAGFYQGKRESFHFDVLNKQMDTANEQVRNFYRGLRCLDRRYLTDSKVSMENISAQAAG